MTPPREVGGRFTLHDEIGRGGTGVVYAATDRASGQRVAVKLLHPWLAADRRALRVLEAEASAAGRLDHPAIVRVIGLWDHEGAPALVSERVQGVSLEATPGAMSLQEALIVGRQVAEALAFAHANGRVHGDVRPGNVLLGPTGARLLDFGVAPWIAGIGEIEGDSPTIRPGETAPEVLDGAPAGVAADLYGLGVVLVRALTGALPWDGPTPFARVGAQRMGPPELRELPRGVRGVVRALLQVEPDRRPTDAAGVARALGTLARAPLRPVSLGGRWVAPVRPMGAWAVHGSDPLTGGPALIRAGLSRRAADDLVRRLRDEGWTVRASREALDATDLLWAGAAAALFGLMLPVIGWVVGPLLVLRWRSAQVRDRLRTALAPARAEVPPIALPQGNELAVAAGVSILALALALVLQPLIAVVPAVLLAWLAAESWRVRSRDDRALALAGRVRLVLAEAQAALDLRGVDLDRDLALQGELLDVDRRWRSGALAADEALVRAEDVLDRARALPAP